MGMPGSVQGPKAPQSTNNVAKSQESFQQMKAQAKEMTSELKQLFADTESIKQNDVGEKLGTLGAQNKGKSEKSEKNEDLRRAGNAEHAEAAAASEKEELTKAERKKRKRRKNFKKKLEGFKELIDEVDIEHLNEDQQQEFKLFQKNERELGRLFRQVDNLESQIEEEERKLAYYKEQGGGQGGSGRDQQNQSQEPDKED